MNKGKYARWLVYTICALLIVTAFFAKSFVLYDFNMMPQFYTFSIVEDRPAQATTSLWFSYGADRELQYGNIDGISLDAVQLYAKTEAAVVPVTEEDMRPIREDFVGYFIAALSPQQIDWRGDGTPQTVYDFARADLGPHTWEVSPREFDVAEIPFELAFAERKFIQVFYENQPLTEAQIVVTSVDGTENAYSTDSNGWIDGLPIRDIRGGFTASYSPDGQSVYRMYYALEDYDYFTLHFFKAHLPLLVIALLSVIGVVIFHLIRERRARRNPAYAVMSRERPGFHSRSPLNTRTNDKFLLIRWLFLIFGFFFWTYAGKLIAQGQALNQIAVPVFSCPFNLDQVLESSCYYFTHLPVLFTRGWPYIVSFLVTLLLFLIFGGRILCGFVCPLGFLQDLTDKLRQALHIRPIVVTDRMNKALQPIKYAWVVLFLCFVFVGGDFCDICPNKVFSPAFGGFWVNLALGGFLSVVLLVGSFLIKRFWCIICPMGYLLGIYKRFNIFKLKKDCTACTECGACYEACSMRIRSIYTERESEDIQTVDCLMCGECINKCPEDNALSMTLCGKTIYKSCRSKFLSRYAELDAYIEEQESHNRTEV